ncbi:hypothetical protein RJ639_036269 [Escallonia herrerae]|uniref:Uncharacterized protein n=1 Tax=Escallonia herrerae TaxID=1293975 RepID=A0AA89B8E8_9ASTE|nr:hypothetical protein RJ639_036269 [Escallonia herrerae]
MGMVDLGEDEDWELVNLDGFICRRQKRHRPNPTTSAAPPPPDPAADERSRRERKKRALTKLKEGYQREIDRWEHLSNTLQAMHDRTQSQQQQAAPLEQVIGSALSQAQSSDSTCQRLVDDLLAQAEAHEAIIQDASHLCDVAEALCSAQEERIMQSYMGLPVWASSPHELIASLCEE